jgi:hypothetical protein
LIRRAFDNAGERKLKSTEISRFIQSRVSAEDRIETLNAMLQERELTLTMVPPAKRGKPAAVYYRFKVIEAVADMENDAGRVKPSGASIRQSKKTRDLIKAIGELRESLADLSKSMAALNDRMTPKDPE